MLVLEVQLLRAAWHRRSCCCGGRRTHEEVGFDEVDGSGDGGGGQAGQHGGAQVGERCVAQASGAHGPLLRLVVRRALRPGQRRRPHLRAGAREPLEYVWTPG